MQDSLVSQKAQCSAQVVYLSHGGGPLPLLGDPAHAAMVNSLGALVAKIKKPKAILVVSAHWETQEPTLTVAALPELIYDYSGFPKASYAIQYPSPGEPGLARQAQQALCNAGFEAKLDQHRGLDHGVFVPLKLMYPEATMPVVQLSLMASLDPQTHLKIGEALQSLQWQDLLVVGSGSSFHNLSAFFKPYDEDARSKNLEFERWLRSTMLDRALTERERTQELANWASAPSASFCHPREEHLLPLHVCYGLAGRAADELYAPEIMGKQSSMFLWHAV